jgi:predicted transposase/invertase (TIGR01784 family)
MTGAEKWAVFLKYSDSPKHKKLLDEIIAGKEELKMANTILNNISTNEDERAQFRARRKFQMDLAHEKAYFKRISEENLLKGRAEGEAIGKAEGKAERTIEVARNLLQFGLSLDQIAKATGLACEEIESLKN